MAELRRPQAYRVSDAPGREVPLDSGGGESALDSTDEEVEQSIELREEQLVPHKHLEDLGEIEVRTVVDEIPGRLEVDAYREEIVIEHEPVGQMVGEREQPREEDGVLVIPVYEEQLVVSKRLVLKERMRVRRVGTTERQLFEDTLRRDRLVIDDPRNTGLVRELYPTDQPERPKPNDMPPPDDRAEQDGGFLGNLVRKALE